MSSLDIRRLAESGPGADGTSLPADRLDADMRHVLKIWGGLGGRSLDGLKVAEARALPTLAIALSRLVRQPDIDGIGLELRLIPGPAGDIRARVYMPPLDAQEPKPLILYFHGGGFVLGDVDGYDATPRALCRRTGAVVVSSHYRLAPEHRFPAAHEDAFAAWSWVAQHAESLGGDRKRLAIVGEGSGGNLAVNVALRSKAAGLPSPLHLGLVTPLAGMRFDLPSHLENPGPLPLDTPGLQWAARKLFRKREEEQHDPRIALTERPDLAGLPPTTLILAEADPLRSEGELLADALRRSGVWVDATLYEGVTHGFIGLARIVNKAIFAEGQLCRNLVAAFGG